jgi:L-asparaginase
VDPEPLVLSACLNAGVAGLVFTGTGAGQLSAAERSALEAWPGKRPLMVRANRCGTGPVHSDSDDERLGLLPAGSLNPQKARVMLLLAVLAGWDRNQLDALITASP